MAIVPVLRIGLVLFALNCQFLSVKMVYYSSEPQFVRV